MASTRETAQAKVARLRAQVDTMTSDRITPAVMDFVGRAESAVTNAAGVARDQAETVSSRVRHQPLVAIVVAAAVGWMISRALR